MMSFALKAALTVLLLAIIAFRVDLSETFARLGRLPPSGILFGIAIALGQIFMLAYRWMLVSRVTPVSLPFRDFIRCTMAMQLFSQGLPASIGGDALRIWWLARSGVAAGSAARHVLLDRLAGFFALIVLNIMALPLLVILIGRLTLAASLAVTLATVLFIMVMASSHHGRRLIIYIKQRMRQKADTLSRFGGALSWFLTLQRAAAKLLRPRHGSLILFWGLLIHAVTLLLCLVLARQAGISLSALSVCAVVPPVLLLSYLPFSIGGWGVREGGMAVGLGFLGVPASDGVFLGLLLGAVSLAAAVLGGLVWLVTPVPTTAGEGGS
jgi:hypothetical protein